MAIPLATAVGLVGLGRCPMVGNRNLLKLKRFKVSMCSSEDRSALQWFYARQCCDHASPLPGGGDAALRLACLGAAMCHELCGSGADTGDLGVYVSLRVIQRELPH